MASQYSRAFIHIQRIRSRTRAHLTARIPFYLILSPQRRIKFYMKGIIVRTVLVLRAINRALMDRHDIRKRTVIYFIKAFHQRLQHYCQIRSLSSCQLCKIQFQFFAYDKNTKGIICKIRYVSNE